MDVRPMIDEASAALQARDHESAERLVERILASGSEELALVARAMRVRILADQKRYDEAIAEAAQVMRGSAPPLEPRDAARFAANLGLATRRLGDRETAREYCELALQADPANEDALRLKAELDRRWWQVWR